MRVTLTGDGCALWTRWSMLRAMQTREKQRSGWEQWSSRTSASRAARTPTGRATALQPHIQQACAAAAAAVASALESRLGALPPVSAGHAGAAVVEQALLLGASPSGKCASWRSQTVVGCHVLSYIPNLAPFSFFGCGRGLAFFASIS